MSKMGAVPGSYVLVTAMKNEEKMLPGLFESVQKQSRRPVLWLIADDASTDDGYEQTRSFLGGFVEGPRKRYTRTDDEKVVRYFRCSWRRYLWRRGTRTSVNDCFV